MRVYKLEAVNRRYHDGPEELPPTPLGFTVDYVSVPEHSFERDHCRRDARPVPTTLVPGSGAKFGGPRRMPDFFYLGGELDFFVSSRFRELLDEFGVHAEYIPVSFNIPTHKHPADTYYFINVLARASAIAWNKTRLKAGLTPEKAHYRFGFAPVMSRLAIGHPPMWHEAEIEKDGLIYGPLFEPTYVSEALATAMEGRFAGQSKLAPLPMSD